MELTEEQPKSETKIGTSLMEVLFSGLGIVVSDLAIDDNLRDKLKLTSGYANTNDLQKDGATTFFVNAPYVIPLIEVIAGSALMFLPGDDIKVIGFTITIASTVIGISFILQQVKYIKNLVDKINAKIASTPLLKNLIPNLSSLSTTSVSNIINESALIAGMGLVAFIVSLLPLFIPKYRILLMIISGIYFLIYFIKLIAFAKSNSQTLAQIETIAKVVNVN